MRLVNAIIVAAAFLGLALAFPAGAVTVNYTVGGTGPLQFPGPNPVPTGCSCTIPPNNGYPGDTVEFVGCSGTFELTAGAYVLKIGTLYWTIDYTWAGRDCDWYCAGNWDVLYSDVNTTRSITVHTSNGTFTQAGVLENQWDDDYMGFSAGSTATFSISGTTVYVTPRAIPRTGGLEQWPPVLPGSPEKAPMCDLPCPRSVDVYANFVVEGTVPAERTTWSRLKALYE